MATIFKKKPKTLSEEEIVHLTTYTSLTREEVEKNFVSFLENHPDGKLTKTTFRQLAKSAFPAVNSEKLCDHIFKLYDTDNNGKINFQEFLLVLYVASAGTPEENLKLVFKIFDTNNDGSITKDELKKIIRDFYCLLGDTDIEKVKDQKSMRDEFMNTIMSKDSKVSKILTVRILEVFVSANK